MTAPLVSVVVPVYNTREYVAAALDSALAQTIEAIEVVVVDDGSTDGSSEIVDAYASRDPRIRVVRQVNGGLAAARNAALGAATGEFVAFLDSDDLWLPEKLERQLPAAGPQRVVFCDAYVLRGEAWGSERIGETIDVGASLDFDRLLDANVVPVLTALLPRTLVASVGGFDPALRSVEDWDLWLRLADRGVEFRGLDEPLAVYRLRPGALSSDPVWMARWRLRVLRKLERSLAGPRRTAAARRRRRESELLVGLLRKRAWQHARAGRTADARADLWDACRVAPGPRSLAATAALAVSDRLLAVAARR